MPLVASIYIKPLKILTPRETPSRGTPCRTETSGIEHKDKMQTFMRKCVDFNVSPLLRYVIMVEPKMLNALRNLGTKKGVAAQINQPTCESSISGPIDFVQSQIS